MTVGSPTEFEDTILYYQSQVLERNTEDRADFSQLTHQLSGSPTAVKSSTREPKVSPQMFEISALSSSKEVIYKQPETTEPVPRRKDYHRNICQSER